MYQDILQKSSKYVKYVVLALVFLLGLGIGLLIDNNDKTPIVIDKNAKIGLPKRAGQANISATINVSAGNFMASINGKAYYPKDCAAGNRIKEENRIWFDTKEEAESQGYKPAQNCAQ